jgi:hypothetical protein
MLGHEVISFSLCSVGAKELPGQGQEIASPGLVLTARLHKDRYLIGTNY